MTVIEVFADVSCPFTHIGLRHFVDRRSQLGRDDLLLRVRAWPLEVVNGTPLTGEFIEEEIREIRREMGTDLFQGFTAAKFPSSSLPALALAGAAYDVSLAVGEAVSLKLRDMLFEEGIDISDPSELMEVAASHGVRFNPLDTSAALADHSLGFERGVIGSPHFFTPTGGFFCPALDVSRDAEGQLRVSPNRAKFDEFMEACLT